MWISRRHRYGLNWKWVSKQYMLFLILYLFCVIKLSLSSSIESCLSAYGVDLSQTFDSNTTLPVECQCSEVELVCTNSAINNPQASESTFPTLAVLFQITNTSIFFPLPKQTLTFWGYRTLIPNAFMGFKFVNTDEGNQLSDENIQIYFSESYRFPTGTFDWFGNLYSIDRSSWPKINIEIVDNDPNNILSFDKASIANMIINSMSIKYAGPATYFLANAFDGSHLNRLEIKNSPSFMGFIPLEDGSDITVVNLIIDNCPSLLINNNTLPSFNQLNYLTIKSSGVMMIPSSGFWSKYESLLALSLIGNQISYIPSNSFEGLEDRLQLLDLSYNPITNLDWLVFENFTSLSTLDLSYTSISTINSFIRIWPNPSGLRTILLKGYNSTFDNRTICAFNNDAINGRINLSTTFIQVEKSYQCDCFLLYIYKDYRKNPNNYLGDWILADRTPACYEKLFRDTQDFTLIEQLEDACNFDQILELFCPKTTIGTKAYTTTTPCFSTQFSQPGQTTIIIGNQTNFPSTTPCVPTNTYPLTSSVVTTTTVASTNPTSDYQTYETTTSTSSTSDSSTYQTIETTLANLIQDNSSTYQTSTYTTATNKAGSTATSTSDTNVKTSSIEPPESSAALPSLDRPFPSNSFFNTTSIIVIVVLSIVSLLLLLIILGLIIYFRNRLRSVSNGSCPATLISPSAQVIIDQKGNKHIYRV